MALQRVPQYLISGAERTAPDRVLRALDDADDSLVIGALADAAEILGTLSHEDELWNSATNALAEEGPPRELEEYMDEEREVLAQALGGNYRLADEILASVPMRATERDPDRARQIVVVIQHQCEGILGEPPSPRRKWLAVRVLRRAFKAIAGGLLVAADIVVPDPTIVIIRVASIAGGLDMIIDAAEMD